MKRTKQTSVLEYRKRIDRAVSYILENLDSPLTLGEVARAACFSEFHFHRIFSAVMHEPLGEYVTRKRLERAAFKLAYAPTLKVSSIAAEFGYASVSSFSKAFNEWFGCRPSAFRNARQRMELGGGKLQTRYDKRLEASQIFMPVEDSAERYEALQQRITVGRRAATELAYLTCPQGYDVESIWATWAELRKRVEAAGVDWPSCETFSLSHDHPGLTPAEHCRYDACVKLPAGVAVRLNLPQLVIPAGEFATFPVAGPDHSILSQYLEFYSVWLPQSGYEPDNFPVVERYLPATSPGYVAAELWTKLAPLWPSANIAS